MDALSLFSFTPECIAPSSVLVFNSAGMASGCRTLHAGLMPHLHGGPWRVGGCHFESLNVTLQENRPFASEPRVMLSRRFVQSDGGVVRTFSDPTRDRLGKEILVAVARFDFGRAWNAASRANLSPDSDLRVAAEMLAKARWHQDRAQVTEMLVAGMVEIVPLAPTLLGQHPFRVSRPSEAYASGSAWAYPVAKLIVDGEQIGWMDGGSAILPMAEFGR
jgi:hypothetical protein